MKEREEQHRHRGGWLRETVFGLTDGLVTTLVFVLAISEVTLGKVVLIALGEMLAGAASMGLGAYLSARTEHAILAQRIATERYEITHEPAEEQAELRQIYYEKGMRGLLLDRVVAHLTANQTRWLNAMIHDELGIVDLPERPPWLQGCLVGSSFLMGALVPIVPFLLVLPFPQLWAFGITVIAAFLLGVVKSRYTLQSPLVNGLEFLGIITAGAAIGVVIGRALAALTG